MLPSWQMAIKYRLAHLPPAIPITFALRFINSTRPIGEIYGIPALWVILETIILRAEKTWLLLSIWLITCKEE